jgi:hypothetical protein
MGTLVEHDMPHAISESSRDYSEPIPGSTFKFLGEEYFVDGTDNIRKVDKGSDRGLRYNKGKLRYDLVPPDAIHEIVKVYTFGAEKYAPRNWEKGMPWMEVLACLKRHIAAWEMGNKIDDESKLPHLALACWNAIALLTYELRDIGTDDRPLKKE